MLNEKLDNNIDNNNIINNNMNNNIEDNNIDNNNIDSINDESGDKKDLINKKNTLKTKLNEFIKLLNDKFNDFIEQRGLTEKKELIFFEIRDNILLIVMLIVSLVLGYFVLFKASDLTKDYEKKVKTINDLKKETLTYRKKTEGNNSYKEFSDLLQYGVKIGENYYPPGGYLVELNKLYPTKESLNFGTFTEGWTSDFITWRGEKIRIPKDILKEYKVIGEQDIDNEYKTITYQLKLVGKDEDINKYLSILSGLKLVSNLFSIKEKETLPNIKTTEVKISFYLKK